MGYLLILSSRPLISLFNSIIAGLVGHDPIGIDLISIRTKFILAIVVLNYKYVSAYHFLQFAWDFVMDYLDFGYVY